jgi:hypothetical protein
MEVTLAHLFAINVPMNPAKPQWYVATLILRCTCNGREGNPFHGSEESKRRPLVERQVVLVSASDPETAYQQALEGDLQHGKVLWQRHCFGLPASEFIHPKDGMTVFDEARGWGSYPPEQYGRGKPPEQTSS